MKTLCSTALAAALSLAVPMMAEARGPGQTRAALPDFGTLDQSGSGAVTLEEFQGSLAAIGTQNREAMIARLMQEADDEGKLDEAALRAGLAAHVSAERAEMQARLFARIDANSDGEISPAEYEAFTSRMAKRMERTGQRGSWREERAR